MQNNPTSNSLAWAEHVERNSTQETIPVAFLGTMVLFLAAITCPIWLPPYIVARLLLFTGRYLPVRFWPYAKAAAEAEAMIWHWLLNLPLSTTILVWFAGTYVTNIFQDPTVTAFGIAYLTLSTIIFFVAYYSIYFFSPPRLPNWIVFIAAEETLRFNTQLGWLATRLRLALWFVTRWLSFKHRSIKEQSHEQ